MLELITSKITELDSEGSISGIVSFKDDGFTINSYLYLTEAKLRISVSTQVGCNVNCSYCIAGKQFKRNLVFDELVLQVNTILSKVKELDLNFDKLIIDTCGVGEPFLNWKAVEPFIEWCFKNNCTQFHVYTIGLAYTDIQDRTVKLGVEYPGFNVHLTLTNIDDVKRNGFFAYKNLPYMILRKIVDYANRFKHYTKKQMYIDYFITGKESKSELEILKKNFRDTNLELRCIIPYGDLFNTEYIDTMFDAGNVIKEYLKDSVNVINFDKESLYIESCLYKN